jgi:hypothetical protein
LLASLFSCRWVKSSASIPILLKRQQFSAQLFLYSTSEVKSISSTGSFAGAEKRNNKGPLVQRGPEEKLVIRTETDKQLFQHPLCCHKKSEHMVNHRISYRF